MERAGYGPVARGSHFVSGLLRGAFWFVFLWIVLWPLLQQRALEGQRLELIRRLERARGSRVITLIHRGERLSLLGIPIYRYIDIDDSEQVLRAIRLTPPEMPIDMILHTPGGLVLAAEQIARALKNHKGTVTVFVPHYAMSGGTLIALAADQIHMDPNAVLGPVDPQFMTGSSEVAAASVVKVLEKKPIEQISDETLMMADQAEKALRQVDAFVTALLEEKMPPERAKDLARMLSQGTWTHDYPLFPDQAKSLGLRISQRMPDLVYELMSLYPQAGKGRPSVGFIPSPYRKGGRDQGKR